MLFKILGTAAGGGFPQWNCACAGCNAAREGKVQCRQHACAAISANGDYWTLINAPPDIAAQIELSQELHPGPGTRETKLGGVILTDAEMDHTIGLLVLREQSALQIHCTDTVRAALHRDFPIDGLLQNYSSLAWNTFECGAPFDIENGAISLTGFLVGHKKPRYISSDTAGPAEWVIGLRIESKATGRSIVYAPAIEAWSDKLVQALLDCEAAFIDGTFWTEDEMTQLGVSRRTATECGHVPLSGSGGLIECVSALSKKPTVHLVHINNTNPLLTRNPGCQLPEGLTLANDGMLIEV